MSAFALPRNTQCHLKFVLKRSDMNTSLQIKTICVLEFAYLVRILIFSGFGGLEVACWPLVPKFAGSNPAEVVGFFRAKKSSARFPSEGK